jgi:hypothetical protein
MRRLAFKLPTVLQINASYAILFHEDGVSEFTSLVGAHNYEVFDFLPEHPSRRIWALVDSKPSLLQPADIFQDGSSFFVVDAVYPRSEHNWLKKVGHDCFYMKPWSLSEVLQAYVGLVSRGSRRSRYPQSPIFRWLPHRTSTSALARKV